MMRRVFQRVGRTLPILCGVAVGLLVDALALIRGFSRPPNMLGLFLFFIIIHINILNIE